ncbi:MAG TPA: septal ring lytic transglycosylase RlpA family protein [Alloacidobacterium sp.]|nr:septal ring lytic transglycosylase RlpA family protein [Alloacidobacterium sp.]
MKRLIGFLAFCGILFVVGCGHKKQAAYAPLPPPPPTIHAPTTTTTTQPSASVPPSSSTSEASEETADEAFVAAHTPIYSETGTASWYGPPYHNRRGANGQIFDQNAMSAAHRTLPMGSLIRVTNLQTGQSAVMRITDRGPFVPDRVLDLSVASAKMVGVWRPGTARVRIDVYAAPKPIDEGGRWCVQIGAFSKEKEALKLEEHLERKYHTANVIEFTGPTGHWVRIRPLNDDKGRAAEIAKELKPEEGEAYLVRLD